jgi:hypothetical protein
LINLKRPHIWIAAVLLFGLGVLLRLPAVFQERQPYTFCDENLYTLAGAYKMYLTHSWTPPGFLAGGANYYPFAAAARLVTALTGHFVSDDRFLLLSRFLGPVLLGAMAPLLVAAAAAEISNRRRVILFAAVAASLSPLVLAFSRIVYPDHLIVAPAAAVTWMAVRISCRRAGLLSYVAAGLLLGLVVSIKYSAIGMALLLVLGHLASHWPGSNWRRFAVSVVADRRAWAAALASMLVFAAFNPSIMADPSRLTGALQFHREHYSSAHIGLETSNGYLYYLKQLGLLTFGILGVMPLAVGAVALLRREPRVTWPLLGFGAAFVYVLGGYHLAINRNIAPLLPAALMFIAIGADLIVQASTRAVPLKSELTKGLLSAALLIVLLAEPAWRDMQSLRNDFQPDSRVASYRWVSQHIPAGAPIGHRWGCYGYPFDGARNPIARCDAPPEPGFCAQYFILDEWVYEKNGPGNDPLRWPVVNEHIFVNTGGVGYPARRREQDRFLQDYRLLKRFSPDDYYGPGIRIYERKVPCPEKWSKLS